MTMFPAITLRDLRDLRCVRTASTARNARTAPIAAAAALTALVCAALLGALAPTASAVVPPFAEEWSVPGAPQEVEIDPFGHIWVSAFDDSIRVYTPYGGTLIAAFGGSGAGDGQFDNPYGMAFDPSGDVYICDYAGARVEKFTSGGVFITSWPIPSSRADHVAVDGAGDVYVTGYTSTAMHKYTSTGTPITDWPMNGGSFNSGVAISGSDVFVVQWDAPVVEQFLTDGTFVGGFALPSVGGTDIEIDALGQFWVTGYGENAIHVFASDGTLLESFGTLGAGPGEFNGPQGIAIGSDGSVYVADEINGRIQRFGASVTGVEPPADAGPVRSALISLAPNPCRGSVAFTYAAPRAERLEITVSDVTGRRVATLQDRVMAAGEHRIGWDTRSDDGRQLAAGRYFVRVAGESGASVEQLVIVR